MFKVKECQQSLGQAHRGLGLVCLAAEVFLRMWDRSNHEPAAVTLSFYSPSLSFPVHVLPIDGTGNSTQQCWAFS